MVNRSTRVNGVLDALHPTHSFSTDQQSLHSHQLEHLAKRLNIDIPNSATNSEHRAAIRKHDFGRTSPKGTRFGKSELLRLSRHLKERNLLRAEQVEQFIRDCKHNNVDTIRINNDTYRVNSYKEAHDCDAPGYNGYLLVHLEGNYRLIAAIDWNPDECYYRTGNALEEQVEYDPYVKWNQVVYPHTLQSDTGSIDTIRNYEPVPAEQTLLP